MGSRDPRVDAYIARSRDFAKPILTHLREVVHEACPEVNETLKWGVPHFEYKGMLCGMASFKEHCRFGFWKGSLINSGNASGIFERIEQLTDLPPAKALKDMVAQAMKLNDDGVKASMRSKPAKKRAEIPMPSDFHDVLKKNRKALASFEGMSPSHRREYLEWITGAKTDATRERRMKTALEWISEGKSRNWKYQ